MRHRARQKILVGNKWVIAVDADDLREEFFKRFVTGEESSPRCTSPVDPLLFRKGQPNHWPVITPPRSSTSAAAPLADFLTACISPDSPGRPPDLLPDAWLWITHGNEICNLLPQPLPRKE